MPARFVTCENQSRRARFVVQAHLHLQLATDWEQIAFEQVGAPPESGAGAIGQDAIAFLPPVRAQEGIPLIRVQGPLTQPPGHEHGVGLLQQGFEVVGRGGETEILCEQTLGIDDAVNASHPIEEWATAVAWFNGHGQLQHGMSVEIPARGQHALHHAVIESEGVSEGDDGGSLGQGVAVS